MLGLRTSSAALLSLAALGLGAAGCGTEKTVSSEDSGTEQAATAPSASQQVTTAPPTAAAGAISTDLSKKPTIPKPTGQPPSELVMKDIVKGKGKPIRSGQTATVRYVGVSYSTGQEFDASWDRGEDFPFPVGQGQVIPGWDQGVPGMRVGGRRELIIPSGLAYGTAGQPPTIQPNETLIFVIDLRRIG